MHLWDMCTFASENLMVKGLTRWHFCSIDVSHLPDIGEKPNQPQGFHFLSEVMDTRNLLTEFSSKVVPAIDGSGFTMVVLDLDKVFCYLCVKALKRSKMKAEGNIDETFVL